MGADEMGQPLLAVVLRYKGGQHLHLAGDLSIIKGGLHTYVLYIVRDSVLFPAHNQERIPQFPVMTIQEHVHCVNMKQR